MKLVNSPDSRTSASSTDDAHSPDFKKVLADANEALSRECMTVACALGVSPPEISGDKSARIQELPRLQITDLLQKEDGSDPSMVLDGLTEGMILQPSRAVQQVLGIDSENDDKATDRVLSKTHKTAQVIGSLVPLAGLVALTRGASSFVIGESLPPVTRVVWEQATAGFLMGSVLTPTNLKPGESLISARLAQGGKSAATYATMSGTSASLEQSIPQFGDDKFSILARRVAIGVVSNTFGGILDPHGQTSFFSASTADSISSTLLFKTNADADKKNEELTLLSQPLNKDIDDHFAKAIDASQL